MKHRFFMMVLVLVTAVQARPGHAEPSTLSADACAAHLPPISHAPAGIRDIYQRWVHDICEGDIAQQAAWQSCTLNHLSPSMAVNLQTLADSSNGCNPERVACTQRMSPGLGGLSKDNRTKIIDMCVGNELSDTEVACMTRTAHNPQFMSEPGSLFGFCLDGAQSCLDGALAQVGGKSKASVALKIAASTMCRFIGNGDATPGSVACVADVLAWKPKDTRTA
ncbi:MAG TPA: hypothetical protein VL588_04360, partial [Bdellovibrionota bacterium]|nr:hypothetical protein [Bdellovibrionota bacterium]